MGVELFRELLRDLRRAGGGRVCDADLGAAGFGEGGGYGEADAAGAAGDEDVFLGEGEEGGGWGVGGFGEDHDGRRWGGKGGMRAV